MIYKDLVAEGKLKKEKAIGIDQIHRFIKRAKKDLETAKIIVANDEGAALTLVYPFAFEGKLIQYIGRILRSKGRKAIYDYRDKNIDFLLKLYKKREKYYRRANLL